METDALFKVKESRFQEYELYVDEMFLDGGSVIHKIVSTYASSCLSKHRFTYPILSRLHQLCYYQLRMASIEHTIMAGSLDVCPFQKPVAEICSVQSFSNLNKPSCPMFQS